MASEDKEQDNERILFKTTVRATGLAALKLKHKTKISLPFDNYKVRTKVTSKGVNRIQLTFNTDDE